MGGVFSMHEGDWGLITEEFWFKSLKVSERLGTLGRTPLKLITSN